MRKALANVCQHCSAMLGACLHTALMLIMNCRYLAKAFRKAGANTQGKPLSRRVIEDAGECPSCPPLPGLTAYSSIAKPVCLAALEVSLEAADSTGSLINCWAMLVPEPGCFAGATIELQLVKLGCLSLRSSSRHTAVLQGAVSACRTRKRGHDERLLLQPSGLVDL